MTLEHTLAPKFPSHSDAVPGATPGAVPGAAAGAVPDAAAAARSRSNRADVRNPMLAIPEVQDQWQALPPEAKDALVAMLNAMSKTSGAWQHRLAQAKASGRGLLEGLGRELPAPGAGRPRCPAH